VHCAYPPSRCQRWDWLTPGGALQGQTTLPAQAAPLGPVTWIEAMAAPSLHNTAPVKITCNRLRLSKQPANLTFFMIEFSCWLKVYCLLKTSKDFTWLKVYHYVEVRFKKHGPKMLSFIYREIKIKLIVFFFINMFTHSLLFLYGTWTFLWKCQELKQ